MMTRLPVAALLLLSFGLGCAPPGASAAQQPADCADAPFAEAQVAGTPRLSLELATTSDERARGLMFRTEMPADHGMLFIFQEQNAGSFWNMNTLIPLTIAYIDRDGTIVDLKDMKAQTPGEQPTLYPSAKPYWFALEANQGWYAEHGVAVGDKLTFCLPE